MAEERRRPALTDPELDAALTEAFAVEPSPEFVARVRERLAGEEISATRPVPFVVATLTLAAAAIVFVVVMQERRSTAVRPRAQVAAASDRVQAATPGETPVVGIAVEDQRGVARVRRRPAHRLRYGPVGERAARTSVDVLIPAAEQRALRRLFERPPTAVLRFPSPDGDKPVVVAAIAVPPLEIDPLSNEIEEGGHQ